MEGDNFNRRGPRQENWQRNARNGGTNPRGRGRGRGHNHGGNQRNIGGPHDEYDQINIGGPHDGHNRRNIGEPHNRYNQRNIGGPHDEYDQIHIGGPHDGHNRRNIGGPHNRYNQRNIGGPHDEYDQIHIGGPHDGHNRRNIGGPHNGYNQRNIGGPHDEYDQINIGGPNDGHNRRNIGGPHNRYNQRNIGGAPNGDTNAEQRKKYPMSFKTLQEIANAEGSDVLTKVHEKLNSFQNLLESTIDKPDEFILIMRVIAKVCSSSFEELKLKLLLNVCNSKLITNLINYLMQLHYTPVQDRRKNNLYWANPNSFWMDFICFCDCIIMRSPSTALQKCRSLIDGASKLCLDGLKDRLKYRLPQELEMKLTELRSKLVICEQEEENKAQRKPCYDVEEVGEPPENFRQMSILPTRDDLVNERPFLRRNIVQGRYRDIEHYLDVQFRLLREDCIGPLRKGILQYITDPKRRKYDNIRVYAGIKFVEPYVNKNKVGVMIQLDNNSKKRLQKINWAHSKRLLYGSLLLFTKNNFNDIIIATVLDREVRLLNEGKLPVAVINMAEKMSGIFNDDSYIMVESEVYFEPYYHVLHALQDPGFPDHIAMSKYIVNVDPDPANPKYVNRATTYRVDLRPGYPSKKVVLINEESWPTSYELGLNDSQYEAYQHALTHEFAVIQGPPGTGKTFLGVKVAKTLLDNLSGIRLLLICFTNHALDQFLEAILPITQSMVRIGGQSRSEELAKYNLMNLRQRFPKHKMLGSQRWELKQAVAELEKLQGDIDKINNGVLSYQLIKNLTPEVQVLQQHYDPQVADPLIQWLFENMTFNSDLDNDFDDKNVDNAAQTADNEVEDDPNRMDIILDEFDDMELQLDTEISNSFNLNEAQTKQKRLAAEIRRPKSHTDIEYLQMELQFIRSQIKLFKEMSILKQNKCDLKLNSRRNPRQFSIADRWSMYHSWAKIKSDDLITKMKPLQEAQLSAYSAYEEARMLMDMEVLKDKKVVGMTTSGAARLRKLLQALKPNVVIVEEAAEVLESHIVTALTKSCQHLILIGDHQQLRPSAAHFKLARDFNMEISLFERMITNGIHSRRLSVQHRMRPEIASLITPSIYEDLQNHQSVESFPEVRGVQANLYFLTHDFKETAVDDSSSRCNHQEADLTLRLANYLMQQGYQPEHVTILAAYSGQMFYMRKQRPQYAFLSKIKITVVDNYQGEESKIILLSLVRNNADNKIGFLGTINRVCVALSRAREGFYMIGNIDILKKNADIWKTISTTLENNGSLGSSLRLKCENHPEQITTITSAKDFDKVPEGGCMLKCNANLPCGHLCPLICHGYDRGHVEIKCPLKCDRIICEIGHTCPLMCVEECRPCSILIEKTLPCKHKMLVYCHQDPTDPNVKCKTMVSVTLPDCGHETRKPCYLDTRLVTCHVPCVFRVEPCGHQCRRKCHATNDPDHKTYSCEKPCARAKKGCTLELVGDRGDHQCNKRCHETCDNCNVEVIKKRSKCTHSERVACCKNVDDTPCLKNCTRSLSCGHFCKKKCSEPCGDCKQKVKKKIPACGHEVTVECKSEATRDLCRRNCERTLGCGHKCKDRCDRPCDSAKCSELVQRTFQSPCGHKVQLPCNVYKKIIEAGDALVDRDFLLKYCKAPCNMTLECLHPCGGSCGECHQGRLHAPCKQACQQLNICGHQCKEPCNQVCPPCKERCEVRCLHTKCNKICGSPCVPCQEKCTRGCVHGRCENRCGEPCSHEPCAEPCARTLKCRHRCRGLCGEPCPDICKECRPDDFPRDFLGDEYDEDDKFVKLQDCSHVLDVDNMDNLMMGDLEYIKIRACPFCRKPIINTPRYKDLINMMYKKEINPIKEKVYGTKPQIKQKQTALHLETLKFMSIYEIIMLGNAHWKEAFDKINDVIRKMKTEKNNSVSLLQLEMYSIYLNVLEMLAESYNKFKDAKLTALVVEFNDSMKLLCRVLLKNMNKISRQQQKDIGNEIKRMHGIVQLSKLLSNPAYLPVKSVPNVMLATTDAKRAILGWRVYEENSAHAALETLQKAVRLSGVVSKQERALIVKAIGLKQGHWYKCPNGHFYCIGECGGAMQESNCIECGARIGGGSHRLRSDNAVATEMDGAQHGAWSEHYNDMRNFDI